MGARRFNIHEQISSADELFLARLAAEVSECHFRAPNLIEVRWGIPSASEADEPKLEPGRLTKAQLADLEAAVNLFVNRHYHDARTALEPFVDMNHEEASKLYIKVLQKLRVPDWDKTARRINRVSTDTLFVPAGSTEVIDGQKVFLIHQGLSKSIGHDAPRCVVKYVIHHEMLHEQLGTSADNPHPPLFRRLDRSFPERVRSVRWLQKHSFSTIDGGPL
ncbi:hypothetical protein H8F21_14540 [Pseudomonas sp. P66]|uniref:Uncharacterized protein n=1 Tax=Pseudomonas arcuscaelestis TaxID=2710591 RepID=A0ABS2C0D8_9PSED|nr:hypothetical protein [Pseudomonas arcuscaelestis]MBM5458783.1 hypothetical protein [Pseudomonas arcuscaelestis]